MNKTIEYSHELQVHQAALAINAVAQSPLKGKHTIKDYVIMEEDGFEFPAITYKVNDTNLYWVAALNATYIHVCKQWICLKREFTVGEYQQNHEMPF